MRVISRSLRRALVAAACGASLLLASLPVLPASPAAASGPVHHATQAALTWSSPVQVDTGLPFPNNSADTHPTSCPTSNLCVMVNGSYVLTTASPQGRASGWASQALDPGAVLNDVDCVTGTTYCIAVDSLGRIFTSTFLAGGSTSNTWTGPQSVDSSALNSVSCTSVSFCAIVDASGGVLNSTNPFSGASLWPDSLAILTSNLPDAIEGSAYQLTGVTMTQSGGLGPFTWDVPDPADLPPGMCLYPTGTTSGTCPQAVGGSASIAGTPDASGTYTFTVTVTDSSSPQQTQSTTLSLVVLSTAAGAALPNSTTYLDITNTFLPTTNVGGSFIQTINLGGTGAATPYTWSAAGSLPPGVTLDPTCTGTGATICNLQGTPTSGGFFTFTISVSDSTAPTPLTYTATFHILVRGPKNVDGATPLTSISCSSSSFCAAVDGNGNVFTSSSPAGNGPIWLGPTPVENPNPLILETTNLPNGESGVAYDGGAYPGSSPTLTATGGSPPYTFNAISGSLPPGLTLNPGGQITGTPCPAGTCTTPFPETYNFVAQVADAAGATNTASLSLTIQDAGTTPPTVTTTYLPVTTVGTNYTPAPLTAAGGSGTYTTWTKTSGTLPLGVTLTSAGVLSGVTTSTGTYNFTVTVTDSASATSMQAPFTIVVEGTAPALTSIACPSQYLCEATDQLGNVLTSTDPAGGKTSNWTITDQDGGSKPINVVTCPSVTLCIAGDAKGNVIYGTTNFAVSTASLPTATDGVSYNATLDAVNGIPFSAGATCPSGGTAQGLPTAQGFCWSVTSGAQALANAGISLNANGTISGLPTIPGTYLLGVQATDAMGATAQATLSLTVVLPSPSANLQAGLSSLPNGSKGEPYAVMLGATGGTPPYGWTHTSGVLPPGLTVGSCPGTTCGEIYGTPSVTGSFTFALLLTDSSSPAKSVSVSETIAIPTGLSWSAPVHADPRVSGNAINGLACASLNLCVFVDSGGNAESSSQPTGPPSAWLTAANQMTALSCPNSNLCLASDTAGNLLSWNDYSSSTKSACPASTNCWTLTSSSALGSGLDGGYANALSCDPSATSCLAVDSLHGVISISQGATSPPWSLPAASLTSNVGSRPIEGISCPISTQCFAVDSLGHVITLNLPLTAGALSSSNQPPELGVDSTNRFTGISCPSLNLCVAVDNAGNIVTSIDPAQAAAATWSVASHVDGSRVIDAVSCPSTSLCVAVDGSGNVIYSTDPSGGNSAWTTVVGVDSIWINSISCPTTTFCVAADGAGNALVSTTPTGAASSWTKTNIDGTQSLNAISCATASTCVAVDAQGQVVAGTSSNVTISLPAGDNGVYSFPDTPVPTVTVGQTFPGTTTLQECSSAVNTSLTTALCVSGGTAPYTWSVVTGSLPPGICLYPQGTSSGACPSTVSSSAAVTAGIPTSAGGYTFTIEVTDSSNPPQSATLAGSITVGAPGAAGSFGWMRDGATPNPAPPTGITPLADGTNALDAISCSSVETCLVGDDAGNTLSTSTAQSSALPNLYPTWTAPIQTDQPQSVVGAQAVPSSSLENILSVACPPASAGVSLCVAGDQTGNLLTSLNPTGSTPALQNWCKSVAANTTATPPISGPTCDSAALEASNAPPPVDNGNEILGIACASVTVCVAVDSNGNAVTTSNADVLPPTAPTWTIGNIESGQHIAINSISCPSASLCVAVDSAGDALVSQDPSGGSSTWSLAHVDGFPGTVALRGGSVNSPNSNPITLSGLTSVSCSSTSLCVAVDAAGNAVASTNPSGGPTAWSLFPVDTSALDSVSCPSNSFCLAVDNRGDYVGALGSPSGGSQGWNLTDASGNPCPCTFQSPSSVTPLESSSSAINSVDCPSTELCLATDQNGNVLIGIPSIGLEIVTTQLPSGSVGTPYSQSLTAIGGAAPYQWGLPAGSTITPCPGSPSAVELPASGLCLSPTGTISGVPTAGGTFNFAVLVTDSSAPAQSAVQTLSLTIAGSTLSVSTSLLPTGSLDTEYTAILGASGGTSPYTWSLVGGFLPTGLLLTSTGTIFGKPTVSGAFSITVEVQDSSTPPQSATAALALTVSSSPNQRSTQGYWLVGSNGFAFPFGAVSCPQGSTSPCVPPVAPAPGSWVAGIAATPDQGGYWLATSSGGVFTAGDALYYGSPPLVGAPIVGIAATPDGHGYWLAGSDGGVVTEGDAPYYGSMGGTLLKAPIVGIAATPDGHGYWLAAADGGIFSFGDAAFYGSTGAIRLNKPVVGMASTPDGRGYWLVASDGAVFSFGDAVFRGSVPGIFVGPLAGLSLAAPIVAMVPTPDGKGYWLIGADGGVFTFGDAVFLGAQGVARAVPAIGGTCNPPYSVGTCQIVGAAS